MEIIKILAEMLAIVIRLLGDLFFFSLCIYIVWKILTGHDVSVSLDVRKRK
jgi:hypothetical protein